MWSTATPRPRNCATPSSPTGSRWRSPTTPTRNSRRKDGPLTETALPDEAARAADLLKEHRESIDRLDAILVYTLGERFKHTQAVGRLKAVHDLPPSDPDREAAQIARLEDLAKRADLDPEFAKKFLAFVIQEVIKNHEAHQS
ncbi:chorismate mutase [Rhodovulum sp. 12E13]|nr:chorismate mutase [Rhodovulum sp. 12E13]